MREQDDARNLGTMDVTVMERPELMEDPKDLTWETKSEVPTEAGPEIKDEDSVFIRGRIRFA